MKNRYLIAFAGCFLCSPAIAQEYVESFDGPLTSVMLNGAVELGASGVWQTSVDNGNLVFTNPDASAAVRYIAIENVVYDGMGEPSSTNASTIEAVLQVKSSEKAGGGLIGRFDPQSKDYVLFTIGGTGGAFFVVKREQKGAKTIAAGTNPAIKSNAANKLKLRNVEGTLIFEVNGTEVIRVPEEPTGELLPGRPDRRKIKYNQLVGIGAFGKGAYTFEEVRVTSAGQNADDEPAAAGDQLLPSGQ
jgi:hypothetical protein